jgi:hypothetical protein
MLDESKRGRFRELRRREDDRTLTPEEQEELSLLIQEIENAEAAYLRPATERLDRELKQMEARIQALEALARRKEALVARLKAVLDEVQAERLTIDEELASIADERSSARAALRS